jgi:tetratricopeptide (TPR) repeat protein
VATLSSYSLVSPVGERYSISIPHVAYTWVEECLPNTARKAFAKKALMMVLAAAKVLTQSACDTPYPKFSEWDILPHIVASLWHVDKFDLKDELEPIEWSILGDICKHHGRYKEAKTLYELALRENGSRSNLRTMPLDSAEVHTNLGLVYQAQEQFERAKSEYESALGILEHQPICSDAATKNNNKLLFYLASLYARQENYQEAETLLRTILSVSKTVSAKDEPEKLQVLAALGENQLRQGNIQESVTTYRQVFDESEMTFGPNDPRTIRAVEGLALACLAQVDYEMCEILFARAFAAWSRILGIEHPNSLRAQVRLAEVYQQKRNLRKAQQLYGRILEIYKRQFGDDDQHTLMILEKIAILHDLVGEFDQANEVYCGVCATREKILGQQHPLTLQAIENHALSRRMQGNMKDAEQLYLRSLSKREEGLNQHDAVQTMVVVSRLEELYREHGRIRDANELLEYWQKLTESLK